MAENELFAQMFPAAVLPLFIFAGIKYRERFFSYPSVMITVIGVGLVFVGGCAGFYFGYVVTRVLYMVLGWPVAVFDPATSEEFCNWVWCIGLGAQFWLMRYIFKRLFAHTYGEWY
jgi:hypothetical protein